ncbi:MAG: Stk1 family PASTA domain-containing Ser/Thr kinase [Candidatus Baltobacteraceae bacterium]
MLIEPEQIFNNRYRLNAKLGEGGMATVFSGTDTLLRRRVAVKVLREQFASDEEFVRRFYQEAESAAKLSHPNIVNTYDVGREGNTYYIVMELVDGPSLAEIVAADRTLPEPVAIDYAAQICSGLAYAHRQGLLHRDIKPANILITKDDVVKLSDFGIARAMSQQTMAMTRPGLIMGSVYYMSPEQAQDMQLHETSDLYSVGVVLYQMLTGKLPYTGESPVTVALKHVSEPVPVIDAHTSGVSPALSSIVNRLLQKQPENRFQSASEVASALREARERPSVAAYGAQDDSATQRISAIPQPPARPSRMPDRSALRDDGGDVPVRRGWTPLALLLVFALVVAAVAGYFATRPQTGAPPIKLDNYVGMSDVQAQQALVNAGLSYKITRASSDSIAPNHVIRQDPAPETAVEKGAAITLLVSSGKPTIGVRDVTGYTLGDAQKDLLGDRIQVKVVREYNALPKDTVLSEKPKPEAKVREGSTVTLVVSNGPAPVKVPNLVGMTLDAAQATAQRLGFTVSVSEEAPINNIPAHVIASQETAAGKTIDAGSTIYVVVSKGGGLTQIPDVRGKDYVTASAALRDAGFDVGVTYAFNPPGPDNGTIINEQPQGGTSSEKGSQVQLWVSVTGYVPDTDGMGLDDAKKTLLNYGYTLGNVTPTQEGADGKVVRTEPEAGTKLNPATPINIYLNVPGTPEPSQPRR